VEDVQAAVASAEAVEEDVEETVTHPPGLTEADPSPHLVKGKVRSKHRMERSTTSVANVVVGT
jgi:hypothetical protein